MAIEWGRIAGFWTRPVSAGEGGVEALLRRAAAEDGLSRAPGGLAERIAAAAFAGPPARPAAVDLSGFLLRPRIVGASLASFSAGAVLAVCLIDIQAGALVRTLMLGVMQSVTTGGYL